MDISAFYPGRFLRAGDLDGGMTLTIGKVEIEELRGQNDEISKKFGHLFRGVGPGPCGEQDQRNNHRLTLRQRHRQLSGEANHRPRRPGRGLR